MSNKLKEIYGTLKLVMPEYDIDLDSDAVQITPKSKNNIFQGITINITKQSIICIEVLNMDMYELDWMFNVKEIPIEKAFNILGNHSHEEAAAFSIMLGKDCDLHYYIATLKDNYGKKR